MERLFTVQNITAQDVLMYSILYDKTFKYKNVEMKWKWQLKITRGREGVSVTGCLPWPCDEPFIQGGPRLIVTKSQILMSPPSGRSS